MNGFEVNQVMVKKHSLEEIFLSMTSGGGNSMKLVTLFWLELYKQKKGWIWLFLLIIPAGTTLAMFLDFSIRYDYLLETAQAGYSSWDLLLLENHRILGWGMFLPMFIGIIYALLYQVEESQNSWKQILCLPVRRESVYFSKFLVGLVLSTVLILLNMLGLVIGWIHHGLS